MKFCIFLLVALSSTAFLPLAFVEGLECCDPGDLIKDHKSCQNNKKLILPLCEKSSYMMENSLGSYGHYVILNDSKGEYLDVHSLGFMVRSPNFCTGDWKSEYSNKIYHDVAMICSSRKIYYNELAIEFKEPSLQFDEKIERIFVVMGFIICFISGLLLAFTAFVYFILPETQDVEGKCTFHLTLVLSICHIIAVYTYVSSWGWLPNFCITQLYVVAYFVLSSFTWSFALAYHMWNRFRENITLEDSRLMVRYRLIGYGIPGLIVLISNIHAHLSSLYTTYSFELACMNHQTFIITLYGALPVFVIELANAYFFFSLLRRLWNVQPLNLRGETTTPKKIIKFKLKLNGKLFVIMGLPWLLLFLCVAVSAVYPTSKIVLGLLWLLLILISAQGFFIFLITVIFRKRVCRGLLNKLEINILPQRWIPDKDSEESIESHFEPTNEGEGTLTDAPVLKQQNGFPLKNNDLV